MLGLTNIVSSGAGGHIKSIQRITRTGLGTAKTADITISSVNTSKSIILVGYRGNSGGSSTLINNLTYTGEFVSSTVVRLTREGTNNITITIECLVIEFNDYVFVQSGSEQATGFNALSSTITLSKTVDLTKTLVFWNHRRYGTGELSHNEASIKVWLLSTSSIKVEYTGDAVRVVNWYVVELP